MKPIDNYTPENYAGLPTLQPMDEQGSYLKRKAYIAAMLDDKNDHSFYRAIVERIAQQKKPDYEPFKQQLRNANKDKELAALLTAEQLDNELLQLLDAVKVAFARAVEKNNHQWMFELEQVVGRAASIYMKRPIQSLLSPDHPSYKTDVERYNIDVERYNQDFEAMSALALHVLNNASAEMRQVGVCLMVVGCLAMVVFVLFMAVPAWSSILVSALASASLLGASTTIGLAFGMSATVAAPGGASLVGIAIGAALTAIGAAIFVDQSAADLKLKSVANVAARLAKGQHAKKQDKLSVDDEIQLVDVEIQLELSKLSDYYLFRAFEPYFIRSMQAQLAAADEHSKQHHLNELQAFAKQALRSLDAADYIYQLGALCGVPVFEIESTRSHSLLTQVQEIFDGSWCPSFPESQAPHASFYRAITVLTSASNAPIRQFVLVDAPAPYHCLGVDKKASALELQQAYIAAMPSSEQQAKFAAHKKTIEDKVNVIRSLINTMRFLSELESESRDQLRTILVSGALKRIQTGPAAGQQQAVEQKTSAIVAEMDAMIAQLMALRAVNNDAKKPLDWQTLGDLCGRVVFEIPVLDEETAPKSLKIDPASTFIEITETDEQGTRHRFVVVESNVPDAALENKTPYPDSEQRQHAYSKIKLEHAIEVLKEDVNRVLKDNLSDEQAETFVMLLQLDFNAALEKHLRAHYPALNKPKRSPEELKALNAKITALQQVLRAPCDIQTLARECGVLVFAIPQESDTRTISWEPDLLRNNGASATFYEFTQTLKGQSRRWVIVDAKDDAHPYEALGMPRGSADNALPAAYAKLKQQHQTELQSSNLFAPKKEKRPSGPDAPSNPYQYSSRRH